MSLLHRAAPMEPSGKGCGLFPEMPHVQEACPAAHPGAYSQQILSPKNKQAGCFLFLKGKQKPLMSRGKGEPCLDHHPRGILSTQFPLEIPEAQSSSADSGHPFSRRLRFQLTFLLQHPAPSHPLRKGKSSQRLCGAG